MLGQCQVHVDAALKRLTSLLQKTKIGCFCFVLIVCVFQCFQKLLVSNFLCVWIVLIVFVGCFFPNMLGLYAFGFFDCVWPIGPMGPTPTQHRPNMDIFSMFFPMGPWAQHRPNTDPTSTQHEPIPTHSDRFGPFPAHFRDRKPIPTHSDRFGTISGAVPDPETHSDSFRPIRDDFRRSSGSGNAFRPSVHIWVN